MSNRFSCNFNRNFDFHQNWYSDTAFPDDTTNVDVYAHYFFYCAQPNATSASIQNVRTNLREYYVKRLGIKKIKVQNN